MMLFRPAHVWDRRIGHATYELFRSVHVPTGLTAHAPSGTIAACGDVFPDRLGNNDA